MEVGKIWCVLRAQMVIAALEMLQFSSGNDLLCDLNTQIAIFRGTEMRKGIIGKNEKNTISVLA